MRMLAMPDQPNAVSVESGGYFFMPAIDHITEKGLWNRPCEQWTDEERSALEHEYQSCFSQLDEFLQSAETTGKIAVFKEHAPYMISPTVQSQFIHGQDIAVGEQPWRVELPEFYNDIQALANLPLMNETVFPERFLLQCFPSSLIRHPALAFPSCFRLFVISTKGDIKNVQDFEPDLTQAFTLRWTRNIYDWYIAAWQKMGCEGKTPIILDADDMLMNPKLVLHFCDLVGLDSTKVQFEWKPAEKSQLKKENPIRLLTRSTLFASSGINAQGKTFQGLSLEGEVAKWKAEFGEAAGRKLERWVKAALSDYEYLASRKLTL